MKDDTKYIGHIIDCAERIRLFTTGVDRESFDANEILRLAVIHLIQTLGEAARLVSADFRQRHFEVPWNQIVGMRNRIVHDYLNVDYDIAWQVVTVDVPDLIEQLSPLLQDAPDSESAD